uniref:FYN binding protein 1 n=1 Tax=Pelusios castaneus TaxID=367368 RepID=A0A8C8RBK0_9SAUR
MAKFNTGGNPSEDVSVNSHPFKVPGQPSAPGLQARKAALEKLTSQGNASPSSGSSAFHKSASPKPSFGVKPSTEDKTEKDPKPPYVKHNSVAHKIGSLAQPANREPGFPKYLGPKPTELTKEDPKPVFPKPSGNKFLSSVSQENDLKPSGPKPNFNSAPQESETKPAFSKVAGVKEKFIAASQENDPKPPFSKTLLGQKPSVNTDVSHHEDIPNRSAFMNKAQGPPCPRPKINSFKLGREAAENSNNGTDSPASHFPNVTLKSTGNRSTPGQIPKNVEEKTEDKRSGVAKNIFLSKIIQEDSGPTPPNFPKPNAKFATGGPLSSSHARGEEDKNSATPKRRALRPVFTLGQPPQKPNRPPTVDLERFRKNSARNGESFILFYFILFYFIYFLIHSGLNSPPCSGTVQDLSTSKEQEKKREKEEKRRLDQEKKEQREKEKKEQEIRKRFKLSGPIQVIHQARASMDYKGGKNDLTVKQGDKIEIIRITDTPEGKWLGRTTKGSYGYIKITVVEIDYDSLKRKQKPSMRASVRHVDSEQEVYDDVGEQDEISRYVRIHSRKLMSSIFPPPPPDEEIYDGIDDEDVNAGSVPQEEDKNDSRSWGLLKILKAKDDKKKSVREKTTKVNEAEDNKDSFVNAILLKCLKVYHVLSNVANCVLSLILWFRSANIKSLSLGRGRSDEKDTRKLKKMEKEEKEFRKKFKFEGEIRVLYSTTIIVDLPSKKWGAKDLQVKPGESVEVMHITDDTKVLCRNEEGKCKLYNTWYNMTHYGTN